MLYKLPGMDDFLKQHGNSRDGEEDDIAHSLFEQLEKIALMNELEGEMTGNYVEPDHHGCWEIFAKDFVNESMAPDFALAARAFLRHEAARLDEYNRFMYGEPYVGECLLQERMNIFIVSMMIHAFEAGSKYTRDLFIFLYRNFYKWEYKILKRFRTINYSEIVGVVRDERNAYAETRALARILGMCLIMGIELDPECSTFFAMLNKYQELMEKYEDDRYEYNRIPEDLMEEARKWTEDETSRIRIPANKPFFFMEEDAEEFFPYQAARQLQEYALTMHGFHREFVDIAMEEPIWAEDAVAEARAILKQEFPKEEFSFRDLQIMAVILQETHAICKMHKEDAYCAEQLLNVFPGDFEYSYSLPENLQPVTPENAAPHTDNRQNAGTGTTVKKPASKTQQPPVSRPAVTGSMVKKPTSKPTDSVEADVREEEYRREIENLREQLHMAKENEKRARYAAAELRKENLDQKGIIDGFADKKKELSALREYVFHLTEDGEQKEDDLTISEMKSFLSGKRIIIIGGHSNWVSKLKREFPDWIFLNPKASGSVDPKLVQKAEKVYFFTDTISHTTYYRFIHAIRENAVPFGYIHGINLEKNIRLIYEELHG